MSKRDSDDEFIPSLEKGLAVIELFSSKQPEWTLSQIARELKITPGSTRRILRTLEVLGYAVANEGRFRLTARVLSLGFAYLSSLPFSEAAKPVLRELAHRLSVNCIIAVLDEREIVYVARETHKEFGHHYVHVGARFPAYATAPGKVLLAALPPEELERRLEGWKIEAFTPNTVPSMDALRAELEETRKRGWAINNQEIFLGQRSIAIPLTIGGAQTASILAAVASTLL
ncbi:MAG: helix-turn-helix domain-containing protein [Sphingomonadales bacterium]|nr:helix-turn-helix domain-containing protein [Sphingomonadales bacterium]